MINLKNIVENYENIAKKLSQRNFDISILKQVYELSSDRSRLMTNLQKLEAERNAISKEIGILKQQKKDASELLEKVNLIKNEIEKIKGDEERVNETIAEKLLYIPNVPGKNTPEGKNEEDNKIIREHSKLGRGKIIDVLPHYEIAQKLDIVDFERAVKLSGSRFWAYKGLGARLVRALENFMLDTHIEKGYIELNPPVIVSGKTMQGTGQLPKFKEDLFKIENRDLYLIPTAEVPVTNYYAGEILDLSEPKLFTSYTPCFRSEAGSGGKDMRGLIRSHQFHKVEIVKITTKEQLESEYKKALEDAKEILIKLELPFQELQLCTGDIGFSAEETVDLEVWIPSEKRYREISSVSSFGDFQGRRASIRYKTLEGKNEYACTINGSGLAIDRTIAAILENCQTSDGRIKIPNVLVKYMNGIEYIG